jgi:hypothetical protein
MQSQKAAIIFQDSAIQKLNGVRLQCDGRNLRKGREVKGKQGREYVIELRPLGRLERSQSLYRLRYPRLVKHENTQNSLFSSLHFLFSTIHHDDSSCILRLFFPLKIYVCCVTYADSRQMEFLLF